MIVGGEAELALLLHIFPEGVEELDGAFAVYADERPLGFDVVDVDVVRDGWEDAWREFHHGVVVGRLWVGPPWEKPPSGEIPVYVDPGRAFGTGAHPTTRLCLELLQTLGPKTQGPPESAQHSLGRTSLLDVGCGSGVLSIGAAKLGHSPVTAVDIDAVAREVTRTNAIANGVEVAVGEELVRADVAVMNIALDVVESLLADLPVDRAITSGYLERDEPSAAGWQRVDRRTRDGWAADLLEFSP